MSGDGVSVTAAIFTVISANPIERLVNLAAPPLLPAGALSRDDIITAITGAFETLPGSAKVMKVQVPCACKTTLLAICSFDGELRSISRWTHQSRF